MVAAGSAGSSVPKVEDHVEQLYRTLEFSQDIKRQIRSELRSELSDRAALIGKEAEAHERTLKKIEAKQEKLVQLFYDDVVTADVFEHQQAKLKAASKLRRVAITEIQNIEEALEEALRRLEHIHAAYLEATPLERRVMNRAIFERIEVGEDSTITGTTLTPTYKALSAWQPRLARTSRNQACAQAPIDRLSVFVRLPPAPPIAGILTPRRQARSMGQVEVSVPTCGPRRSDLLEDPRCGA